MQELHDQLMQSCGNAQAELNKQAKSIGEAQLVSSGGGWICNFRLGFYDFHSALVGLVI